MVDRRGWAGRTTVHALGRGAPFASRRHDPGHDGMCGQRPRPPRPAPRQPAVAGRGGGNGHVDGHAARSDPGGSRARLDGDRGRVPRCRPRHAGRGGAGLRAEPVDRRRDARRRAPRVRAERTAAPSTARLPGAPVGPGLVRHDERQVAAVDHRRRRAVRGLPDVGVPPPAARGGRGHTRHADRAARADDPARLPGVLHALEDARRRSGDAGGTRVVRVGERDPRRGERRRGRVLDRRPAVGAGRHVRVASLAARVGCAARRSRAGRPRDGRRRATSSRRSSRGTTTASRTTWCSGSRSSSGSLRQTRGGRAAPRSIGRRRPRR